jgi:hypothetical protein
MYGGYTMQPKVCAFTGHRPAKIPDCDHEESHSFSAFHAALEASKRQAIIKTFPSSAMATRWELILWRAEAVQSFKEDIPISGCILFRYVKHSPTIGRNAGVNAIFIDCQKPIKWSIL